MHHQSEDYTLAVSAAPRHNRHVDQLWVLICRSRSPSFPVEMFIAVHGVYQVLPVLRAHAADPEPRAAEAISRARFCIACITGATPTSSTRTTAVSSSCGMLFRHLHPVLTRAGLRRDRGHPELESVLGQPASLRADLRPAYRTRADLAGRRRIVAQLRSDWRRGTRTIRPRTAYGLAVPRAAAGVHADTTRDRPRRRIRAAMTGFVVDRRLDALLAASVLPSLVSLPALWNRARGRGGSKSARLRARCGRGRRSGARGALSGLLVVVVLVGCGGYPSPRSDGGREFSRAMLAGGALVR